MAFSMIASKKAALIRKLAFNDARALQATYVQSTRSFNTTAREVEALDGESKLGCGSDRRAAWRMARHNDVLYSSRALDIYNEVDLNLTKYFRTTDVSFDEFPVRIGCYEIEDANRLEMRVDMPGLGKEHVKLSTKQNTLIIKGDGEEEIGEKKGERRYHNRIDFPDGYGYKLNEIEAEMKNGILKIVVPKVKEEETKHVFQINVK